jgi:hypothetical protein
LARPALTRSRIIALSNFAKTPKHLEEGSASRRGRVDRLLVEIEVDAGPMGLAQEAHEVL